MKRHLTILLGILVASTFVSQTVDAAKHALAVGGRYHMKHSAFQDLPFDDGDMSYGIAYEYHEDMAYWQLAADYTPDATGTNGVDYVITPQLNLVFTDSIWRGGLGVLSSYIRQKDPRTGADNSDWTDLYWQFLLGVSIPIQRFNVSAMAYYTFEDWASLDDFEFNDVEYGVWLSYTF